MGQTCPATAAKAREVALARGQGLAALVATHNNQLARRMDRIVRLDGGMLVDG